MKTYIAPEEENRPPEVRLQKRSELETFNSENLEKHLKLEQVCGAVVKENDSQGDDTP